MSNKLNKPSFITNIINCRINAIIIIKYLNDYYYYSYIYNMTPIGVKQRLTKNLFSDANDANKS